MKKTIGAALVCAAFVCMVSLATIAAENAQPGPLTGTWNCVSHGGENGDLNFTLDLQENGENLSGSVSSPLGDADLSGTFKNNQLKLTINGQDVVYTLTATLNDGKLAGKWSTSSGEKGTWEGKKAPSSQP